jgi:hypothetical protein
MRAPPQQPVDGGGVPVQPAADALDEVSGLGQGGHRLEVAGDPEPVLEHVVGVVPDLAEVPQHSLDYEQHVGDDHQHQD